MRAGLGLFVGSAKPLEPLLLNSGGGGDRAHTDLNLAGVVVLSETHHPREPAEGSEERRYLSSGLVLPHGCPPVEVRTGVASAVVSFSELSGTIAPDGEVDELGFQ